MSASETAADDEAAKHLTLNHQVVVSRLVSTLAHDVNNALQVISGSVELLQSRSDVPEPVQKGLARIASQVATAAAAIGEFSEFARLQAEADTIVSLGSTVTRAVAFRRNALARARVESSVEIAPGDLRVVGRPSRLLLAVLNLLLAAERAVEGVPAGCVAVRVAVDGADVVVRVSDNGRSLPVVEPSHLVAARASAADGDLQGLGLAVSAAIAHAHRGSLSVEPLDTGTAFVLRLPRRTPA